VLAVPAKIRAPYILGGGLDQVVVLDGDLLDPLLDHVHALTFGTLNCAVLFHSTLPEKVKDSLLSIAVYREKFYKLFLIKLISASK
jgi:hypothetical protein